MSAYTSRSSRKNGSAPLDDPQYREEILHDHPIIQHNYTVVTESIQNTYALLRERVWLRRTGAYLYAPPRSGKTTCLKAVAELLEKEFPSIFCVVLSAEQSRTGDAFLKDVMYALGLRPRKLPRPDLIHVILTDIATQLADKKGNQFIFLIDEMQCLTEEQYGVLLVLHNRLENLKISMTTLGFAQPEINEVRNALFVVKAHNLVARFLAEPICFQGCANVKGLTVILQAYDNRLEFPVASGWTFTRFFLPQAYAAGFRLEHGASLIWESMREASSALKQRSLPMEHLTHCIEHILLEGRLDDSEDFALNLRAMENAVVASRIHQFSDLLTTH